VRSLVNDSLRFVISYGVSAIGFFLSGWHWLRIILFRWNQKRLKQRYGITWQTPVLTYGLEVQRLIDSATRGSAKFAVTSGSTGLPKRIPYTKQRLRALKLTYTDVFVRACWAFQIKRTSLYVFSAFSDDESLTSILLSEKQLPRYLATLQAPYRVQTHPAVRALALQYGATAVRLWLLSIANPGILYSTNPSTLATFLHEINNDWQQSARLIKHWSHTPERFEKALHKIARRLESRGTAKRLLRIARSDAPLPLEVCAPAIEAYICWTGGYVKPFLKRIASYLPSLRYRLIPMYSMSTETVETVSHFHQDTVSALPLAKNVLYEFIEETATDSPDNLLCPAQLEIGKPYAMVVSDSYGLRRYQTCDLFLCEGMIAGIPRLAFLRRRGLEYSLTGEKLTDVQIECAFHQLKSQYSTIGRDRFLSCVPSQPFDEVVPHYKVLVVGEENDDLEVLLPEIACYFDQILGEVNCEYRSKRASGRLGPVRFIQLETREFLTHIIGGDNVAAWETQFKFLPLYRQTWETGRVGE
jgi:GH3 auxin-responsive promoter